MLVLSSWLTKNFGADFGADFEADLFLRNLSQAWQRQVRLHRRRLGGVRRASCVFSCYGGSFCCPEGAHDGAPGCEACSTSPDRGGNASFDARVRPRKTGRCQADAKLGGEFRRRCRRPKKPKLVGEFRRPIPRPKTQNWSVNLGARFPRKKNAKLVGEFFGGFFSPDLLLGFPIAKNPPKNPPRFSPRFSPPFFAAYFAFFAACFRRKFAAFFAAFFATFFAAFFAAFFRRKNAPRNPPRNLPQNPPQTVVIIAVGDNNLLHNMLHNMLHHMFHNMIHQDAW